MRLPQKELERLGTALVRSISEDLVRYGVIKTEDKSNEELQEEIIKYIADLFRGNRNPVFVWATDYTSTLLREARKFARLEEHELSCLFYATWFEHWLNGMINAMGKRKKFTDQEITSIIRDTQFRAKSTWLLHVLGLKPISDMHLRRMQTIVDARNSFVHYKWKHVDIDDEQWKKDEQALAKLINDVEKTVSYLHRLHNQQFFAGRKRKLLP